MVKGNALIQTGWMSNLGLRCDCRLSGQNRILGFCGDYFRIGGDPSETRKVGFLSAVILDECMSGLCASVHRVPGYAARSASMGSSRAARTAGKRDAALATEKARRTP